MLIKSRGFTLLELLITMAVGVILLNVAVPSMSSMMSSTRVSGAAEQIQGVLELNRTESVEQNQDVTLTFHAGSNWSVNSVISGSNWSPGSLDSTSYKTTSLTINLSANPITYKPTGLVSNTGTLVISDGTTSATLTFNPIGRTRICSNNITKYPGC